MREIQKLSDVVYQIISRASQDINNLNRLADKEINDLKKEIAKEELQNRFDGAEILAQTDIRLSSKLPLRQKAILLELYLNQYFGDVIDFLKDTNTLQQYKAARNDLPTRFQLNGLVWRLTNPKKKENLLQKVEEVQDFNQRFEPIVEKISNEWRTSFELSEEALWEDFYHNESTYYEVLAEVHRVEKALISNTDYKNHQALYQKLTTFQESSKQVFQKKQAAEEQMEELLKENNQEELDKELEETSLDEFSQIYPDPSLRLGLLAQQGIQTVKEMDRYPSFLSISGIGEVTNEKLKLAVDHYKEQVNQSLGLQFDTEVKSTVQTEILRFLYSRVNHKKMKKDLEQFELSYMQMPYDLLLRDVNLNSEWSMQQLAKSEKLYETYQLTMKKLTDFAKRHLSLLKDALEVSKEVEAMDKSEIWSHFNAHAADYYAILERDFGIGSANVEDTIKRSGLSEEIIQKVKAFELNEERLNATLRSWQDFGTKYALLQKKVLIGDEMGLGKTLISIAAMSHLSAEESKQHFLVICPASIMTNWERELNKFSTLKVFKTHGSYRDSLLEEWKVSGGVAITTYETSIVLDFSDMEKIDMITVDEAHYAKNPHANRTKRVRELTEKSEYALYLTGTPLENRVSEMTEIIKPLAPEIAQTLIRPRMTINALEYRKEVAPVYLRRTKKDVSLELPPLTQIEEWEEFGDEEFEEYKDAVANGKFMRMRRAAWTGGSRSQSPKLNRLIELAEEAKENGDKVIVFSFFRDVIATVVDALGEKAVEPIHGDVPINQRQAIIDEFRESETKNVLVAQINTAAHGLNIQFANTIIFCEPQIKPSLESQAVARAYRMGQVNNVFVYRLLTVNSIDELMMDMLGNKQALFDEFADRSHLAEKLQVITETEQADDTDEGTKNIQNKIINLESARLGLVVDSEVREKETVK